MTTSEDPTPRLVAGRYRLGAVLGRGTMGAVWSAQDEVLGRAVAIKEVLLPPGIPDAEADALRERTLREARAIAALSHPNVVTVYDIAWDGGAPFVVMELVASHSLADLLKSGPLPAGKATAIGIAVAAALQAAHAAGITHRDVKPGNVLVAHDGRIKLTDFGIARNPADQTMTATGLMLGSPAYIAPEVASGGQVSPAADLWGLGATLFATVEGRPPYDAGGPVETVSAVVHSEVPRPTCGGALAEVIAGLMVKDPERRLPLAEVRRLLGAPATDAGATQAAGASGASAPATALPPLGGPEQAGTAGGSPAARSTPPGGLPAAGTPPRPGGPAAARSGARPGTPRPPARLAADPGPLPFAPKTDTGTAADTRTGTAADTRTDTRTGTGPRPARPGDDPLRAAPVRIDPPPTGRSRLRAVALWIIAALVFLGAATASFSVARIAGGAPVVPHLTQGGSAAAPAADLRPALVIRDIEVPEDGRPVRFSVGVPQDWPEFRELGSLGGYSGAVVRFVSPDGSEVIAVQRITGFLAGNTPAEFLDLYGRELGDSVVDFVEAKRERMSGGALDATIRTVEGPDEELRRTSYLRVVPSGADLWVLRVTVPTERESTGRTRLFDPVVAVFAPRG